MFLSLFAKECKQIRQSLVYYIFLVIFILFMVSQLGDTIIVQKPQRNQEDYGTKVSYDENEIMRKTLEELVDEIVFNCFETYPVGFCKQVILSDEKLDNMKHIVEKCTGKTWDAIRQEWEEQHAQYDQETVEGSIAAQTSYRVAPDTSLSYETFQKKMQDVCKMIGRGSKYEKKAYSSGVPVPMTYEDAVEEFNDVLSQDGITGSYMRLFCDYAVIMSSLLPIFMGVTRCIRDKRAKVQQVIYTRKAKAPMIILSRYLANVVMMIVPIIILAFALGTPYLYQAQTLGIKPKYFAFLGYCVVWLLPTILFVLALSFLLTELLNGVVAIIIQVVMGIGYIFSATTLVGNFGWNLIPRWNSFGGTLQYLNERSALYQNRLLYTGLAIACIVLTTVIYEYKRQGGLQFYEKKH